MAKPPGTKAKEKLKAKAKTKTKAKAKTKDQENNETTARKIWLAGLGAYGKSLEDAHERIDKASQDASRFFHDLVDKGQSIEDGGRTRIRERLSEARGRIDEVRERISSARGRQDGAADDDTRSVEDMIGRVRQRLGFGDDPVQGRLDVLARQVNSLARAVSGLTHRGRRKAKNAADEPAQRVVRTSGTGERKAKVIASRSTRGERGGTKAGAATGQAAAGVRRRGAAGKTTRRSPPDGGRG